LFDVETEDVAGEMRATEARTEDTENFWGLILRVISVGERKPNKMPPALKSSVTSVSSVRLFPSEKADTPIRRHAHTFSSTPTLIPLEVPGEQK
jgi:hypothetical protein